MPVTAHPASQRGIDVHALPWSLRAMRLGFALLRRVSRRTAARLATKLFVQPRRHVPPAREIALGERAQRLTVELRDKDVQAYVWAPPRATAETRTCVLVHGWEGRATQLGSFVEPLVGAGFRVVAFDHVGHGASDGRACSLPTMRDTLRAVVEKLVGRAPEAVVAHSMGTFATSLLLADGWRGTRAVYVSPPDDLMVYFARYLEIVTGSADLLPDVVELLELRFGESAESFEFHRLVETLDQPLLVIHSTDDFDVPIEAGRYVHEHWPGAELMEVERLGHRRILRDAGVVAAAVAFVTSAD